MRLSGSQGDGGRRTHRCKRISDVPAILGPDITLWPANAAARYHPFGTAALIKALIVSGVIPPYPGLIRKRPKAFQKLDLMVVMDLFMTETAELADIVLPCASSLERTGLAYNYALTAGIPYAMLSRKIIEPIGESWPDWKFYSELGRRMGYGEYFPWNSDEEVNAHWLKPSGITMEQLEENPAGLWFGKRCYDITAENQIKTPSGKIELYSETLAEGHDPIPVWEPTKRVSDPELASEYPLILNLGARIIEYPLPDEKYT